MQDKELLNIAVITDDSTGMYEVRELDFGVTGFCREWLESDPSNRNRLMQFLIWLAGACRRSQPPFGQRPVLGSGEDAGDAKKSAGYGGEGVKCQE